MLRSGNTQTWKLLLTEDCRSIRFGGTVISMSPKNFSVRSDGRIVVDVNRLLSSQKVKSDMSILRKKIQEADSKRAAERKSSPKPKS